MKTLVAELKVGDVIMPPAREVSLWMRRECRNKNLPDSALHLTITNIEPAESDTRGPWLLITADQAPEWFEGRPPYAFKFKARPETPWVLASVA